MSAGTQMQPLAGEMNSATHVSGRRILFRRKSHNGEAMELTAKKNDGGYLAASDVPVGGCI